MLNRATSPALCAPGAASGETLHLNSVIANLTLPYPFSGGQRMTLSFVTEGPSSSLVTVQGEGVRPESDMVLSGDAAHLHLERGASIGLRLAVESPFPERAGPSHKQGPERRRALFPKLYVYIPIPASVTRPSMHLSIRDDQEVVSVCRIHSDSCI